MPLPEYKTYCCRTPRTSTSRQEVCSQHTKRAIVTHLLYEKLIIWKEPVWPRLLFLSPTLALLIYKQAVYNFTWIPGLPYVTLQFPFFLLFLCFFPRNAFVYVKNPHLDLMEEDILYHLDLGTKTHNLPAMFGDIKVTAFLNTFPSALAALLFSFSFFLFFCYQNRRQASEMS